MKKSRGVFIFLLVLVSSLFLVPETKSVLHAAPSQQQRQSRSYARNFYRGLSSKLSRDRKAYPGLTDNEFANFREVTTTGIGKGKLYRSSSPIKPWGNRNVIADNASRKAGIKTFINLSDTEKGMKGCKGFPGSYYSGQRVIALGLDVKFQSENFRRGLAEGIRFIASGEAPFLIHCDLGKDRTGFVCAVLECLMGASAEEVTADYMVSFHNYFGIEPGTKDYEFVADNEIRGSLARAFEVRSIEGIDLSLAAEKYLLGLGVSANDIASVRRILGPAS